MVECELLTYPSWKCFPAQAYDELKRASRGSGFWNENLRQPILDFLGSTPIFLDQEQNLHTLNDFFVISADIKGIFADEELQKATGKKSLHPTMLDLKVIQPNVKEIDILYVLQNKVVLEGIKNDTEKLSRLYCQIEHLTDYYIRGRPRGRGTQDIPLWQIPFVLGDDTQFHPPVKVKLLQEVEEIPAFLSLAPIDTRVPLHPEIAKDEKAVTQLKRCGIEPVGLEATISIVKNIVNDIATKEYNPPTLRPYGILVEASLWLMAHGSNDLTRLVAQDLTLQLPEYVFASGAHLDWRPLWEANFIPGYCPISSNYFKFAPKYGLKIEQLHQCLEDVGVHGFSKEKDARLITVAGESLAKKFLKDEGHDPVSVADHDKLGYDIICREHCSHVFEVKGMSDASDVSLQASQVDKAKELGEKYILVCVYNLPDNPNKIGYKEVPNPEQIWVAEEKARVPKKKWLKA